MTFRHLAFFSKKTTKKFLSAGGSDLPSALHFHLGARFLSCAPPPPGVAAAHLGGFTFKLPGCFSYTRDLALIGKLSEADTADAVVAKISVWSAADLAAVIAASGELRLRLLL